MDLLSNQLWSTTVLHLKERSCGLIPLGFFGTPLSEHDQAHCNRERIERGRAESNDNTNKGIRNDNSNEQIKLQKSSILSECL